jgi:two-component system alkaline phosphatase synthesis response regulator PhoP
MEKIAVPRGVIIADDSSIIRDNIRMAFGAPWRIFVAANGVEAVEYARRIKAELVILDVRMPRLDGMEACRLIRQLPDYANVPIVLLTAFFIQELEAAAARCGASRVFSKPISVATVQSSIVPLVALARGAAVRQPTGKLAPRPLESLSPVK